jgi:uncharacterized protein YjbI with pentapeptide repeats
VRYSGDMNQTNTEALTHETFANLVRDGRKDFSGLTMREVRFDRRRFLSFDFRRASFNHCVFRRTNFDSCNFAGAALRECHFDDSQFEGTDLSKASCDRSLIKSVTFRQCSLMMASFYRGVLDTTSFVGCNLAAASFVLARLEGVRVLTSNVDRTDVRAATFYDCDITAFCAAKAVSSQPAPAFDWTTICKSVRSPDLLKFLLGSGMPEVIAVYYIDAAKATDPYLVFRLMQSTFISYGAPDIEFARQLRDSLHVNGVRTFLFESDAVPGERLHRVMRAGVNEHDRVIVICSLSSLSRKGVRNEIEETLAREAREGGMNYLVPIALDDHIFTSSDSLAMILRDRVIADFRDFKTNSSVYHHAVSRLLRALVITGGA